MYQFICHSITPLRPIRVHSHLHTNARQAPARTAALMTTMVPMTMPAMATAMVMAIAMMLMRMLMGGDAEGAAADECRLPPGSSRFLSS